MKELFRRVFLESLEALSPKELFRNLLGEDLRSVLPLFVGGRVHPLAWGKGASEMALAWESLYPDSFNEGCAVVLKDDPRAEALSPRWRVCRGNHPLPDGSSLKAGLELFRWVRERVERDDLLLLLMSGGASALAVLPAEGITLEEKVGAVEALMRSGASIGELNTLRRHLSSIKGGRLAKAVYPASTLTLALSDVSGGRLEDIGSGPGVPDGTTFFDLERILRRRDLWERVPPGVARYIRQGLEGLREETPKEGSLEMSRQRGMVLADTSTALSRAELLFRREGFDPETLSADDGGEAREVGRLYAQRVKDLANHSSGTVLALAGGETTVTVKGRGKGGRNLELLLSMAMEMEGFSGSWTFLSAGTDGRDGTSSFAGGILDEAGWRRAKERGANPRALLDKNDSHAFFVEGGCGLTTGPTGTNVRDLRFFWVRRDQ